MTAANVTVPEAEARIAERVTVLGEEEVPLARARGRVLREALVADRDLPPYDRATLDGVALARADWAAGRRVFRIGAVRRAGQPGGRLDGPEVADEVMTGAVVPEGADVVLAREEVEMGGEDGGRWVRLAEGRALVAGEGIHRRGSDAVAGAVLAGAGRRLGLGEVALAASVGRARVRVGRRPRVAVVTTGDEIVEVDAAPAPQQVRASNRVVLMAMLEAAGAEVTARHVPDDAVATRRVLEALWGEVEAVVTVGGISAGRAEVDVLPEVFAAAGVRLVFRGVRQRPGKPMAFGVGPDGSGAGGCPVFSLPGNPVSALVNGVRYVVPAVRRMQGEEGGGAAWRVELAEDWSFAFPLVPFPAARRAGPERAGGATRVVAGWWNTSGDVTALAGTDGFLELPPGPARYPAGTVAGFWPWP